MTNPKTAPKLRGEARFKRDPTRRSHFLHLPMASTSCQRFEIFQTWVMGQGLSTLSPSALTLACLLACDALVIDEDLRGAFAACAQARRWETALRICWSDGTRIDARNLSAPTVFALKRVTRWESFETAKDCLIQRLAIESRIGLPAVTWEGLLGDGLSWAQTVLPPVLFGHVSASDRLSALPLTALARESQQLALKVEVLDLPENSGAGFAPYVRAFEAAMLGRAPSAIFGGAFIRKLSAALRPPAHGSNAAKRASVLNELRLLAAELDGLDEICALLYIFALDLAENGTRGKGTLAPTTPCDYVQSFAADFHVEANGRRLTGIEVNDYAALFGRLLDPSIKYPSYRIAALKAFHFFLRAWWSVPLLPSAVFRHDSDTSVAANVVWPFELQRIDSWFDESESTRFARQLRTALALAGHAMLRIRELLVLRLSNVIDEGSHLTIEIAREISDGKEKSKAGRRRVHIYYKPAMELIRSWLRQRGFENATPEHYLFGSPSHPLQLADSGKMYFWMSRLLKAATGESSISVHSLRHSIATRRFAAMLVSDADTETNPLDLLADEAGHVGGHVTAINYGHIFEPGLRFALDRALLSLPLAYSAIHFWTGMPEAALRQRVSRGKGTAVGRASVLWSSLRAEAASLIFPGTHESIPLEIPTNPLSSLKATVLSVDQIIRLLSDISAGLSVAQTGLRQDLSEALVVDALKLAGVFAEQHGDKLAILPDQMTLGMTALRDRSGRLLGLKPDFPRTTQPRWALMLKAIKRCEDHTLSEATDYWRRALANGHLAVRPGPGWDCFVDLLKEAAINTNLIAMKWSAPPGAVDDVSSMLTVAQAVARQKLGRTLEAIAQSHRAGRPSIWLVIASNPNLLAKDGSGCSLTGLHCAMFSAWVWVHLCERAKENQNE